MSAERQHRSFPSTPVPALARIEGAALAVAAAVAFVAVGFAWWWLLALFLLFDLSMVGYAMNDRVGAIAYNAVHNYAVPAVLVVVAITMLRLGGDARAVAFIAGCWLFHVGVDRAVGFGPRPLH